MTTQQYFHLMIEAEQVVESLRQELRFMVGVYEYVGRDRIIRCLGKAQNRLARRQRKYYAVQP